MTLDNNITPFARIHTDNKTNINDSNQLSQFYYLYK